MRKLLQCLLLVVISFSSHVVFAQTEICNDAIDNDGDGLIDCQDPDCPSCVTEISCSAPYTYYMPPIHAETSVGLTFFDKEDFIISTLGRVAHVKFVNALGTELGTATIPTTKPVLIKMDGTDLPKDLLFVGNAEVNKVHKQKGLYIESDQPLQVTYRELSPNNQDILQLQGQAALGRSFYPASQTLHTLTPTYYENHFVSVIATEGKTEVSFKIPTGMDLIGVSSLPADRTIKVTLNRGETYVVASKFSITGMLVTSDKDIVVNSGSQHSGNIFGMERDAGFHQIVSTKALENDYIAVDGGNGDAHDYIVIVSIENGTNFQINGVSGGLDGNGNTVPTSLDAGDFFTYVFPKNAQNKAYVVKATNRVYVYHASSLFKTEFGMDILPPINDCIGSLQIDFLKVAKSRAILIVPTDGLSSLVMNGIPHSSFPSTITTTSIPNSSYSSVVIENGDIKDQNRITCKKKFHLGVISGSGKTGNYAFFSNYEKTLEVLDPITLLPTIKYDAGEATPGKPMKHCLLVTGCGNQNTVTNAIASGWDESKPSTKGDVKIEDGCIIYTMKADAPPCARETVNLKVENEFGISKKVCLTFENITKPFTITKPNTALICELGTTSTIIGSTATINIRVNVPTGTTPTYEWTAPNLAPIVPTNTASGTDFNTSIEADQVGFYQLTVTVGTCSQTIDVNIASKNCNDNDGDGIPDDKDPDDDNDGILDVIEQAGDLTADADGDNIPNHLDLDSDNDGIPDVIEAGGVDVNGDGLIDNQIASGIPNLDTDGDGIPNSQDLDSDNDGIPDLVEAGAEDSDNNGIVDSMNDSNGNGLTDVHDGGINLGKPLLTTGTDTDNDGKPDSVPAEGDFDGDGIPNYLDLDSDGDGITDVTETNPELDKDKDGMVDGTVDADKDGIIDNTAIDAGTDFGGDFTPPNDFDADNNPDYLDIDSDGDGIVDNIEGQTTIGYKTPDKSDTDGDGINDAYDDKKNTFGGSGVDPTNTDGTDKPDYLDLNSDNDGLPDLIEGWDTDGNGTIDGSEQKPSGEDKDNDGLDDGFDTNKNSPEPTNGTATLDNFPDLDKPGNDKDWRESDGTVNNPPIAEDDKFVLKPGQEKVTGTLTTNDSDPENDPLVYTAGTFTTTNGGTIEITKDGSFTYTPPANFSGDDCYKYTVCDDAGNCSEANVCISNDSSITIPQGFSPNADGTNDAFVINGTQGRAFTMKIFNRWGNIVYEQANYQNDWTGICNVGLRVGDNLPDGTYFCVVVFDDNGEKYAKYLTLKR